MGADFSRIRSNPLLDFAGIELKQGGVVLDADWNELVAVIDRRLRAVASDVLGRSTVSSTTPDAFLITASGGGLTIGKGRLYVDGLLAENHGAATTDPAGVQFDPLMAEVQFADPIDYAAQPYLPSPPDLPTSGRHLVYLDVWDREVTHLERPDLVEVAVGVETSSRRQTVWQVRVFALDAGGATCESPDADLPGWVDHIAPSAGRLTTGTFEVAAAEDPCELPPTGGYRGLENQTYRVEIHDPGQPGGTATFKWSRENASVGSRVAVVVSASELELETLGRDDVLRFNTGDWVEILDDVREFSQQPGEMRQITVNEAARRITFTPDLPADMLPSAFPEADFPRDRNLRVRRWDQAHQVLEAASDGTTPVYQDLDAGITGVIDVPAAGTVLLLEHGVTVSFSTAGTAGFRAGDYWVFSARTADASVEILTAAPPRGIHHHYARLGIWDVASGSVTDCRTPWPPPAGGGHDCTCTQCVTPESHASGALTIQAAVDNLRDTGGTVCLGAGQYELEEAVRLPGMRSIRIRGQGAATVIVTPGTAFAVSASLAIAIEDAAILSLGLGPAIDVRSALGLSLQRLAVAVVAGPDAQGVAISLGGAVIGATIRDNAVLAPYGVRAATEQRDPGQPIAILLSAVLRIEDNVLWCAKSAVALEGLFLHLMSARITGNEILGCREGAITALGLSGPNASMRIAGNDASVEGPGITTSADGLWIENNRLGMTEPRAGASDAAVALRPGPDPNGSERCQVLANQVSGFTGPGIAIQAPVDALIVKLNIVERCGAGIVMSEDSQSSSVSIENNHLSEIGVAEAQTGVVGIGVLRTEAATMAGNVLRAVGRVDVKGPLRAGMVASGVRRLRVHDNDASDVGPPGDYIGIGAGIAVHALHGEADIGHNHVARDGRPVPADSKSQWFALLGAQPASNRPVSRIGVHAAVLLDDGRMLVFGGSRPYAVAVGIVEPDTGKFGGGPSVSVIGNALAGRGFTSNVDLAALGDCLFSSNRCEHRASTGVPAVQVAAATVILNANRVQNNVDESVRLLSDPKRITVLGNITTGIITVAGSGLEPKWTALNARA